MLGKIQKNYAANHPNWYLYLDLQYLQEASYGGSQTRRCQMLRKDQKIDSKVLSSSQHRGYLALFGITYEFRIQEKQSFSMHGPLNIMDPYYQKVYVQKEAFRNKDYLMCYMVKYFHLSRWFMFSSCLIRMYPYQDYLELNRYTNKLAKLLILHGYHLLYFCTTKGSCWQ